ncbi:GNAT family N-acetyltransferase [Pseudonocardia phyllosphaerae]|uniref:GNAT family N-acetyltransferase n=1 Tax=Pseudonocardia phyllosphaerae TaxID=3390502 RepID=UPI0039795846
MHIRDARPGADAPACAAIYAPYVRDTVISFETEVPSAADMAERIVAAQDRHAWLVAEDEGEILGYAYGSPFKPRPAYAWSCEVSVYLHPDARGRGLGRTLYDVLLLRLAERGMVVALAGIALPNEASIGLHRAAGFAEAGVFAGVGWKLGAWRDVAWYRRALVEPPAAGPVR